MGTWSVAQAKAKFSELITLADAQGPQAIVQNGKTAAIVVSAKEWQHDFALHDLSRESKAQRKDNLADFFATSPLPCSDLELTRNSDGPRPLEL